MSEIATTRFSSWLVRVGGATGSRAGVGVSPQQQCSQHGPSQRPQQQQTGGASVEASDAMQAVPAAPALHAHTRRTFPAKMLKMSTPTVSQREYLFVRLIVFTKFGIRLAKT